MQKDMYGNFEWSSRPKLMLQSFSFFDESEDEKSHLLSEEHHHRVIDLAKEKIQKAKLKIREMLHQEA